MTQPALTLTAAAEGLAPGADRGPIDAAREAVEAFHQPAALEVCPQTLEPVDVSALLDFSLAVDRIQPFENAVPILAALHESALDSYASFAEVIRGPRGQAVVVRNAVNSASGLPGAAEAAMQAFVSAIAAQIATRPPHPLFEPARIVAEVVPSLRARLDAVEQRHAEHAETERQRREAEWQRLQLERKAAERAAEAKAWAARLRTEDDDQAERRRELRAYYLRHGAGWTFTVAGQRLTGEQCAQNLREGDEYAKYFRAQSTGEAVHHTARAHTL